MDPKGFQCMYVQRELWTLRLAALAGASVVVWGVTLGAVAAPQGATSASSSASGLPQVQFINQQLRQGWEEYLISPSARAPDGEWCRRVYLDVLGRIPSLDELQAFLKDTSPGKKSKLVERLLYDDGYTEQYARNWTTIWTNLLIGRTGGNDNNSLINREGMQKYLRDSFARNKPYDRMVYELVTAKGVNAPGAPGFNGAVNFLTMKLDEKAAQATAQTSRLFLGMQVQCTQCHNHPFNDWKQNQFWEMNAFFRQTVSLRRFVPGTNDVRLVELTNQDFAGEGNSPEEAELYYELRNGLLQAAYPKFVDGTTLPNNSGYVEDVDRRKELGQLIVNSPYMPEAIVNRMWSHFFGYGFTKPVDDMGPHNPATHPELLQYLGKSLRAESFNLKELTRWIVLSDAYGLTSRVTSGNASDDPLLGEPPKFSHFYLRQMRAEELYESLLVATEAHKTRGSYDEQEKAKREWLRQFTIAFGTDEGDETTTFNGTIPQALMLFNGDLIKRATNSEKGSFLWRVANSGLRPNEKVNRLFLAGLARKPTSREVSIANQLLVARQGDAAAALQDLWWAILNSNEFILNH